MDRLAETILALLALRRLGATVCPSEVARAVGGDGWRALMPSVRDAAGRLADDGRIVVTQRGEVVDVRHVRGPVRLRLSRRDDAM